MTSKERVIATLQFQEPDRVPLGEFAVDFDTVEKIIGHETYYRAKARSQIAFWEGRHDEVAESWRKDHIELHKKLELDIVTFGMASYGIPLPTDDPPPKQIAEGTWEDEHGRIYKYSSVTADITCVKDPVAEQRQFTVADFEAEPQPPAYDPRTFEIRDALINELGDELFIAGPSGGELGMMFVGGMERGMLMLIEQPEVVKAAVAQAVKRQNLVDEIIIHPQQDGVMWGNDFGYKTGPFISPAMFAEFYLEGNKQRVGRMHDRGLWVMKHCCGNVNSLMDYFIEVGYDCYQAIQGSADMDICKLKQSHGDRIALWGGVAVENLAGGTPEQVREDVRRAMQCAKPGGGFILGSSHSIAVGTRYDNFMAMLDEYHKLADY